MTWWGYAVAVVLIVFFPACMAAVLVLAQPAKADGDLEYRDSKLYRWDAETHRWHHVPRAEPTLEMRAVDDGWSQLEPRPMHSRDTL